MVKSLKVMLIPNNKQRSKMFCYAGASRFAYNWALAREKESFAKDGTFLSDYDLRKEFTTLKHTDEYVWLNSISNNVTKTSFRKLRRNGAYKTNVFNQRSRYFKMDEV